MADPRFEELKKRLVDGYPDDIQQLKDWEAKFKQASLTTKLKKNPAFDLLIDRLVQNIVEINELLITKGELSDADRAKLFVKRDCWQWFLDVFKTAEMTMRNIEKEVEKGIENLSEE